MDDQLPITPPCCGGERTYPEGTPDITRAATEATYRGRAIVGGNERDARLSACMLCIHYTEKSCNLCVQLVMSKTRFDEEECPIGRWPNGS